MASLTTEPEKARRLSIAELIRMGEGATLEFKSTLQWDVVQNQANPHLRHSVVKTIGAFLNSDGGALVIGIEDTGIPYGLKRDLDLVGGSPDRFVQTVMSLITGYVGPEYAGLIKTRFDAIDDKQIFVIEVEKAPEPAFVKGPKGKEFYVRLGNTTRLLDAQETVLFIEMNW